LSTAEQVLVGFGRALRTEGLTVGTGQLGAYCAAVTRLDPGDAEDVYWAGRCCLVSRREDVAAYDRVFARWFGSGGAPARLKITGSLDRVTVALPAETGEGPKQLDGGRQPTGGGRASRAEVLRQKRFADCTPEELAALHALMAQVRLLTPSRRSRRTAPARRGRATDLRRSIRRSLRTDGELVRLVRRERQRRHRRLVLLLDVSGSMAEYSRALLQFAHSAARGGRVPTEVFCFGTRLTRVTHELRRHRVDQALAKAAEAVVDWEGGTRIGESLAAFLRLWGRRGAARGAVVVVCSDGLDRGDPELLAGEMAKLSRLAHRVVWVNPLKGDPRYQPLARGMSTALPFIDEFLAGHDLASLEGLAAVLAELA
jgi:uncharacterized protein with von Willebrand factor type A (vWA) domain